MDPTIIHFEIQAEDVDKLKSFYENLFGWKIMKTPGDFMEYWVIQTVPIDDQGMPKRPGVNGGMYKKQSESNIPVNYIRVEDIDRALVKIVKLGGKVTMGKQEVPGIGYVAQIRDPEGNPIAMIHPMRE
jgi:predicted enzyme related to lactoylglutathione lyase